MKIIAVDNFNREDVADRLVCEGIKYRPEGEKMLEALRAACNGSSTCWYQLVEDDYRLSRGMADIVGDPEELAAEEALAKCSKRAKDVMARLLDGKFYAVYDFYGVAGPKALKELSAAGLIKQQGRVKVLERCWVPYGTTEVTLEKFPERARKDLRSTEP